MGSLLVAIGLVLLIEGLVLALLPDRLEELLAQLAQIPIEARRLLGFLAMTAGALILWGGYWLTGA